MNNCFTCNNEFIDKARSGDPNARLCRACWDKTPEENTVQWIQSNVINEVGMCSPKSRNCPEWKKRDTISSS